MAIYALGASVKKPSEEFVRAALEEGVQDRDGRPFEVINLVSLVDMADYTSTHGYEDTFIQQVGKRLKVTHRIPGRIRWMQGPFGGRPRGQLAKTPHNVRVLAANYRDHKWKIMDPVQDAEIKALSDKLWEGLTPDQRTFEESRIKGANTNASGGKLVNAEGKTPEELALEEEKKVLRHRELKLRERENDVDRKETTLAGSVTKAVQEGKVITKHVLPELQAMKMHEVRRIARSEFNIPYEQTQTKMEIIDQIMKAQGGNEIPEEETLAVTG